jgi:periplasmic protein TonB
LKNLLLAGFLAVAVHAVFFWVQIPWAKTDLPVPQVRAVSIRLIGIGTTASQPAPANIEPRPQQPPMPENKKTPLAPVKSRRAKPYKVNMPINEALEPLLPMEQIAAEPSSERLPPEAVPATNPAADFEPAAVPMHASLSDPVEVQVSVPRYDLNPAPAYPALARRRQYQGTVILEVLVDAGGYVTDLRVSRSSGHPILDRSALADVRRWRFAPARRGGRAVEMWVTVPVRYELN